VISGGAASLPSLLQGHGVGSGGTMEDSGVRGKLSSGASGCRMSYRNSGMMGTKRRKGVII